MNRASLLIQRELSLWRYSEAWGGEGKRKKDGIMGVFWDSVLGGTFNPGDDWRENTEVRSACSGSSLHSWSPLGK